jgi:hypothetical protein
MARGADPLESVWANRSVPRVTPWISPVSKSILICFKLLNLAKFIEKVL